MCHFPEYLWHFLTFVTYGLSCPRPELNLYFVNVKLHTIISTMRDKQHSMFPVNIAYQAMESMLATVSRQDHTCRLDDCIKGGRSTLRHP